MYDYSCELLYHTASMPIAYFFRLVSNVTNIIVVIMHRYSVNEISKRFVLYTRRIFKQFHVSVNTHIVLCTYIDILKKEWFSNWEDKLLLQCLRENTGYNQASRRRNKEGTEGSRTFNKLPPPLKISRGTFNARSSILCSPLLAFSFKLLVSLNC